MKKTFWQINQQVLLEDVPGGAPSMSSPMPTSPGGPPMGGGMDMGGPPMSSPPMGGGMGGPPMGGGMDMGMPPMGGGMGGPPMGGDTSNKPIELKPLDVWDVLNKILDGKKIKVEKQKKTIQPQPNNVQSDAAQPPVPGMPPNNM